MTVDVLFPFYGDVGLMKLAVESVLGQTYEDFRLIVVDDAYPDDSVPTWFAQLDDDRVTYTRNSVNLGVNGNFKKCLSFVTNELTVIMGSDDLMAPTYLDWLVRQAARYPEVDLFQPGVVVIDESGAKHIGPADAVKAVCRPRGERQRTLQGETLATSLLRGDWLYFPSLGWRSKPLLEIGFQGDYQVVLDLALIFGLIKRGASLLVDSKLEFFYRRHADSVSSKLAVDGRRFNEEHELFVKLKRDMGKLGWTRAARAARLHLTSRLHAASLLPAAVRHRSCSEISTLIQHVVS